MGRAGIRFRPPEVEISPEIRWVLLRAFGPIEALAAEEISSRKALELARTFELSPRIGARHRRATLCGELGEEAAEVVLGDHRHAVFVTLQRAAAARDVARVAAGLQIPLVLLKFSALYHTGVLQAGSRSAGDIDVLAAEDRLADLFEALCAEGYRSLDFSSSEQHLPPLDHPKHGLVELHGHIPGVSVEKDCGSASLGQLAAGDLLSSRLDLPGDCRAPRHGVLMAHVLAHGIAQHGDHPDAYPPTRMLSDLIDLEVAAGNDAGAADLSQELLEQTVSTAEIEAVRQLNRALRVGARPWDQDLGSTDPAGIFLRHVLAGLLDRHYRNALNLRFFSPGLPGRRRPAALAGMLKRALFPSRGEIDKIYGRSHSTAGYLARRLSRPFYLLSRVFEYGLSYVKLRLR